MILIFHFDGERQWPTLSTRLLMQALKTIRRGLAMTFEEWDKSTGFEGNAADAWAAATLAERERCVKMCQDISGDYREKYEAARTACRIQEAIEGDAQ